QVLHAVGAEDAQQVVLERQVEARRARVALATRTAAQLVVDPTRLVPLGAQDVHAPGLHHLLALRRTLLLESAQHLLEALLALLPRLLQRLADLLHAAAVLPPLLPVPPLRRTQALLERRTLGLVLALDVAVRLLGVLIRLAPGRELAVARVRALDEHRHLELPPPALLLQEPL